MHVLTEQAKKIIKRIYHTLIINEQKHCCGHSLITQQIKTVTIDTHGRIT